jgi:hypothetical protein
VPKKPDNFSEDANILPYGSNVSAPAITLPDTDTFKSDRGANARNYLEERLEKIKREYEELVELANVTETIYKARYNFVPKVGQVYHLYWTGTEHTLSMIENWERFEYHGSYLFTSDNVWEKV